MPTVAETARITTVTGRTGAIDTPEERAWLVWTRFKEASEGDPTKQKVIGGALVIGQMKAHARFLFPEAPWGNDEAEQDFMRPVYRYLRASGNAYVLRRNIGGSPHMSEWFLSDSWRDQPAAAPPKKRRVPDAIDKRAAKLTAHEAGEDRAPAPVTVRFTEPTPKNMRPASVAGVLTAAPSTLDTAVILGIPEAEGRGRVNVFGIGTLHANRLAEGWGCPKCPRRFPSYQAVGSHMRVHYSQVLAAEVDALRAKVAEYESTPAPTPSLSVAPEPPSPAVSLTAAMIIEAVTNIVDSQSEHKPRAEAAEAKVAAISDAIESLPIAQAMSKVYEIVKGA